MKIRLLSIVLLLHTIVSCQQTDTSSKHHLINTHTDQIFNSLVKIRRDLHINPELSGQEKRTSKIIEDYLLKLGLEVKMNIGGYGVVGILNGEKKGKKIAWRADIDALQNNFPDIVDFKSKNKGIRHRCGHDIHTAIGLGIANVLAKQKKDIKGTVYFIFQPSEENFKGAKLMITDGLFDLITPDEIYGMHIIPTQVGEILVKPNEMYSYTRRIRIKFKKNSDLDSLKRLTKLISQNLLRVKPNSKPWLLENILEPTIGVEDLETIYQNYLIFQGEFIGKENEDSITFDATFNETNRDNLIDIPIQIEEQIRATKYKDALLSVGYISEVPTVINNPLLTDISLKTLGKIYGDKSIKSIYGQIPFFNDDFAYFQQQVPGVYFFLGGSNLEKNLISMPHTPNFAVDEESIRIGVKSFSSLIMERVNTK